MLPTVASLLLCALVTCGRTESHSPPNLQLKRAALSSQHIDNYRLSQDVFSRQAESQSSSPVERLTLMDFSVPELSAMSPEEMGGDGVEPTVTPTPSVHPLDSNLASTEPQKLSEPNPDLGQSFDFGNVDGSSTFAAPEKSNGRTPPRIHFRRFHSDDSLASLPVAPTQSPESVSEPLGDFVSLGEDAPSKTHEPESDEAPEATEASDDEEVSSAITLDNEPFVGPKPELSTIASSSPEVLEIDEVPEEDADAGDTDTQNSDDSKPRASVFVSGPVTSSVTWSKGEPPVFSFSTSKDSETDGANNDEDKHFSGEEDKSEAIEPSDDLIIDPSSEPEIDAEDEGDVSFGRLQPKSPGRPIPSDTIPPSMPASTQKPDKVFDFLTKPSNTIPVQDASNADDSTPSSTSTSGGTNAHMEQQSFGEANTENVSFFPKPLDTKDKETVSDSAGEDITESFIEASPVAVLPDFFDGPGILGDDTGSMYPEFSGEPEASEDVPIPSGELGLMSIALVVRHPPSFSAEELAEEIRLNSNEFITPDEWEIVSVFQLSQLSKFSTDIGIDSDVLRETSEDGFSSFELLMEAQCIAETDCVTKLDEVKDFIRDGHMDQTLAAHDFNRASVFLEGEMAERTNPMAAVGNSGLGTGVIAGIAVGGVAIISLIVLVAVVATNMRNNSSTNVSSEYDSDLEFEDDVDPQQEFPLEQGSFMISNFGGTPRNSNAMIPWLNDSSSGSRSGTGQGYNSGSFISVDSLTPGDANRMSQYRIEETTSSASGSDIGEEVLQVVGPEASGSTVYAVQ
ncbi:unnamed protein product [Agarophyton chilense]|eukprot:gb/GEZJ01000261.1/.p1 GENE.gb/GEZJ01000261.1/~~gb/GEZJ01000261.1/.p1  ORF type:complete len:795 (-),score=138.83 gb/GEZJ01000261.1/:601-2985(-)